MPLHRPALCASTLLTMVACIVTAFSQTATQRREIPTERRATMSQGTEVVAAVDTKTVPQFQVDPFWPKPLPNNWLIGQVAGVYVDKRDHVWIIHRPNSLSDREAGATPNPPISKCCFPAHPVLQFDQEGKLVRS